jgi:tryptophanyl-tRNA synthetase
MSKPVILTGIRANNELHIGNYFGAIQPLIKLIREKPDEFQFNLFIPDLHSITTDIDYRHLPDQVLENIKCVIAAGFPQGHPDTYLYRQSFIPAHSELAWILECFTGMGEMSRMTQFKDKSSSLGADRISLGLFNYPVLMASDILIYNATYVPVGEDQTQHIEFARDIAMRFNKRFGEIFIIPKPVPDQNQFFGINQALRIKDLADPTKKMSKSDKSDKGIVYLNDDPEAAVSKIMNATTDSFSEVSYDVEKRPGISNLLQLLALLCNRSLEDVVKEWTGKTSYNELKLSVANTLRDFLINFQKKLADIDSTRIQSLLNDSESALNIQANTKLAAVQKAVGLRS